MPISETKLRELIAADEGQYHDRKSLFEGPPGQKRRRERRKVRDQIAEQVAGFANADGGIVIFGVEDDRTITGHAFPADVIDQMLRRGPPCCDHGTLGMGSCWRSRSRGRAAQRAVPVGAAMAARLIAARLPKYAGISG